MEAVEKSDMVFGIGPAGTGKTYLAVAMAVSALIAKGRRIILARPARMVNRRTPQFTCPARYRKRSNPIFRPLYDALYDMLEPEKVDRFLEKM